MTIFKKIGMVSGLTLLAISVAITWIGVTQDHDVTHYDANSNQKIRSSVPVHSTYVVAKSQTISSVDNTASSTVENPAPEQLLVGENPEYPTLATRLTEMQARRDGKTFDPQQVLAAMQQPSAWQADDSLADQLQLSDEDRYDGRAFIRFNPLKIETLMPGDRMEIPIEQANGTYQMVVENVEVHGDGTITWRGHLQDFEQENQVTITQSKGVTYAGVFTPDAPFVLEAHGEAGWIASTGTLFKGQDEHLEIPNSHTNSEKIP